LSSPHYGVVVEEVLKCSRKKELLNEDSIVKGTRKKKA